MENYGFGHDPNLRWTVTQHGPVEDTRRTQDDLIAAQKNATPDGFGDLSFVVALIERMEAIHRNDPEADVSLTVAGKWIASFESVPDQSEVNAQNEAA